MARKDRDLFGLVLAYDSSSVTVLVVSAWTSLQLLRDSFIVSGRQLLVDSSTRINRSKLGVHVRPQLCWLWMNHCAPLLVESRLQNSYSLELSYSHLVHFRCFGGMMSLNALLQMLMCCAPLAFGALSVSASSTTKR